MMLSNGAAACRDVFLKYPGSFGSLLVVRAFYHKPGKDRAILDRSRQEAKRLATSRCTEIDKTAASDSQYKQMGFIPVQMWVLLRTWGNRMRRTQYSMQCTCFLQASWTDAIAHNVHKFDVSVTALLGCVPPAPEFASLAGSLVLRKSLHKLESNFPHAVASVRIYASQLLWSQTTRPDKTTYEVKTLSIPSMCRVFVYQFRALEPSVEYGFQVR